MSQSSLEIYHYCTSRPCTLLNPGRPLFLHCCVLLLPAGWPPMIGGWPPISDIGSHLDPDIWRQPGLASDHLILERLANGSQCWPGGSIGEQEASIGTTRRKPLAPPGEILRQHQEKSFGTTRRNPSAPPGEILWHHWEKNISTIRRNPLAPCHRHSFLCLNDNFKYQEQQSSIPVSICLFQIFHFAQYTQCPVFHSQIRNWLICRWIHNYS